METRAFAPLYTPTTVNSPTGAAIAGTLLTSITITATNGSATAGTLPGTTVNNAIAQIQIANTTTAWAYVNFGATGAVTAATVAASYPIAPGSVVVVSVASDVSGASVILGTAPGTATAVIFTRGEGL